MNNKDQGNAGEAFAIYHYTSLGQKVSKPLFENCPYDLIVDKGGCLFRVQVKTSRVKSPSGRYEVSLRTNGGNRSGTGKSKNISSSEVDLLFVLVEDGRHFEIPCSEIDGQTCVTVG